MNVRVERLPIDVVVIAVVVSALVSAGATVVFMLQPQMLLVIPLLGAIVLVTLGVVEVLRRVS